MVLTHCTQRCIARADTSHAAYYFYYYHHSYVCMGGEREKGVESKRVEGSGRGKGEGGGVEELGK